MKPSVFSPHSLGVLCIVFASFLWGTTGVSATFAPEVGALAIGAAAMGVGGLLQTLFALQPLRRNLTQLYQHKKYCLIGGLAVAIYPLAFYSSMRLAGVTIGTVISIGAAPILSFLIEMIMDKARLRLRWLLATTLGLIGIALLCLADTKALSPLQSNPNVTGGILLGLLAALTYSIYSWAARRLIQRNLPARAAMGSIFGLGGLLLMPVLFFTGSDFLNSWQNLAVGTYMALVPMFLGYLCFGYGLAQVQASTAVTITLLEPVIAAVLAVLIVGERLPILGWSGIVLIIACLLCITWPSRPSSRLNQPFCNTYANLIITD